MTTNQDDEKSPGLSKLPGLFTPSGQPEQTLYPDVRNRAQSTDVEKGVEPFARAASVDSKRRTSAIPPKPNFSASCELSRDEAAPADTAGKLADVADATRDARRGKQKATAKDTSRQQAPNIHVTVDGISPTDGGYSKMVSVSMAGPENADDRLYSIPEGSFYNLASFLPARLMDGAAGGSASNVPTTGNDTPRVADLDATSPEASATPYAEAPCTDADVGKSSYYIFDPDSPGSVLYMHKDVRKERAGPTGYHVRKIPMKRAFEKRQASYLVPVSNEDGKAAPEDPPKEMSANATDDLKEMDQMPKGDGKQQTGSSLDTRVGISSNTASLEDVSPTTRQNIIAKASERLLIQRHLGNHMHVIDQYGKHVRGSRDMYLVNEEDIHNIVETVINRMGRAAESSHHKEDNVHPDPESTPKLDRTANAILPGSATVADPATTISMPKTSYTSVNFNDMQVRTKTRASTSATTATIVSRSSIAEVTWAQRYPSGQHAEGHDRTISERYRAASDAGSLSLKGTTLLYSSRRQSQPVVTYAGLSQHYHDSPPNMAELVAGINRAQSVKEERNINLGSNMTSFPQLPSRHCTNDWLSAPTRVELVQPGPSTLYNQGVDAHCGVSKVAPAVRTEEPTNTRKCNHSMFSRNPFHPEPDDVGAGDASPIDKRLGVSLGVGSHRRRSSQPVGSPNPPLQPHDNFLPSLMDKIRQGGHKMFHHHHSHKGSENLEAGTPVNSPGSGLRSRDSVVRSLTPEPPAKVDSAGIYQAMTGTRLLVHRKRHDTCSEDNRPHVCENEVDTPLTGAASPA